MTTSAIRKALITCLFILVIGVPLFYLRQSVYPYTLPKTAFFEAVAKIIIFLWIALAFLDSRYRPKQSPVLLALLAFVFILVFTATTGLDVHRSFWSTQERALGVVTILHFALLALALSSLREEIPWRKLLLSSIAAASLASIIAFLQIWNPNLLLHEPVGNRPGATFGNPTFFAGYLLFNIFIAIYFALRLLRESGAVSAPRAEQGRSALVWLGVAIALMIAAVFRAQTRGDILGFGAGILTLLVLFAAHPPETSVRVLKSKSSYGIALGLLVFFAAAFWLTRSHEIWEKVPGLNRFRDIQVSEQSLLPRFIALRAAWKGFLDRPLSGVGWDNFNIVFNKYYDPASLELSYQETRFDKPHNAFLEYAVVGGLPLFLAYLAFFGTLVFAALRLPDRIFGQCAIAALVAYAVRNFFAFETLGSFLMLFLLVGILHRFSFKAEFGTERERRADSRAARAAGASRFTTAFIGALGIFFAVFLWKVNIGTFRAVYHQYWGFVSFVKHRHASAIEHFRKGTELWTPYQSNFMRDYATATSEAYFYNPEFIPADEAWRALRTMEEVALAHPRDAYNHYTLVDIYNQLSDLDPETLLPRAEREAAIALELSPNRQEVYFSLAKTKTIQGDHASALALLQKTIELNPRVPDAHFYYGLVLFAKGDLEGGYASVARAREMGRRWKTYHEPRVVANYFADSGRLEEAIALYEQALRMNAEDLEAKVKLGIAYFFSGDAERARKHLLEVSRQFDFTKSPSYNSFKPILDELGIVP